MLDQVGELLIFIERKGETTVGEISIHFDWGHAKCSHMIGAALDTSDRIEKVGRKIRYIKKSESVNL